MRQEVYYNSDAREAILEVVHNERDREILLRRYIDGRTIEELADEFYLSVSQIKRILRRHRHAIFAYARRTK
jgi:DNA-directed RNA polymerase specialized sigma24 family protein